MFGAVSQMSGGDIQRWHNLNDVDIVAPARWVDIRVSIQNVDTEKRIVTFDRHFEIYRLPSSCSTRI